jgi:hypothetical protein
MISCQKFLWLLLGGVVEGAIMALFTAFSAGMLWIVGS